MKQDYFNFKKYINSEFYPKHMDFINNDCAPDILRFMNIKVGGKKNASYYKFLVGIGEEGLPVFTESQVLFANYLSAMLPLVSKHEYLIFNCIIRGITDRGKIEEVLKQSIADYNSAEYAHAIRFMLAKGYVSENGNEFVLNVSLDDQFEEYLKDLIDYGLTRFTVEYGETNDFKLWQSYRMDQVQLKFLKNPAHNQVGTYYYDDTVVIFASLKKNASIDERLKYKDKFIEANVFQWESMADVSDSDLAKLNNSTKAYLFIRKVEAENGITLPFTYVGTGKLTNPRKQVKFDDKKGKNVTTYLFDIPMDNELPDYLQYDFGVAN